VAPTTWDSRLGVAIVNDYPTAVIWDLDGTLIDSAPDLATALNILLRENNRAALETDTVRTMIGNGVRKLVERGFRETGDPIQDGDLPDLVTRFLTIYEIRATDETELYDGALAALQIFHDAGIRQAICTNKPEAVSRLILKGLSISHFFGAIVGGDTTAKKKPDPLPIRDCLQALGANAIDSLFIGDSAVDVATAKAVDMQVGIVSHGYAREPVASIGADFVIDDLRSLPVYVSVHCNAKIAEQC
jgi:phosphoglycolate phosphatase